MITMLKIFSARLATAAGMVVFVPGLFAASVYPSLPEPVTSFGAFTADGWLYVFGGHKGERHDYSAEMVSGSFHRLKLNGGKNWETLPSSTSGQGLALVASGQNLYRIGGMVAHNHEDAKQDLHSLALVQRFDIKRGIWEDVASLPSSRSSHDAAVIGNKIYVAGGWELAGGTNKPAWHTNALVLDLSDPSAGWKEFPQPFQRRALAVAVQGSRLFCMGGMDSKNDPSLAVDIYDTASGQWTKGPDLPAGKYKGFSCSAIAEGGRIYVTTFKGDLLRLSSNEHSWEAVGRLEHPRMAHRLVTAGRNQLIALGGEDGEENKTPDLELLTPAAKPMVAKQSAPLTQTVSQVR